MDIVNLTGHVIRLHPFADSTNVIELPANLPKAVAVFFHLYDMDSTSGIWFEYNADKPHVLDLPDKREDTIFVVSCVVASVIMCNSDYHDRDDLYTPRSKTRKNGSTYGCKYLSKILC